MGMMKPKYYNKVLSLIILIICLSGSILHAQQAIEATHIKSPHPASDSIQLKLKLDSVSAQLNHSLDSIGKLNLPKDKYYARVDSLFTATRMSLNGKKEFQFDTLNPQSNELIRNYRAKLRTRKQRADSLAVKYKLNSSIDLPQVDGYAINTDDFKVAGVNTPEFNKPDMPDLGIPKPLTVPSLNTALKMPGIDKPKEIAEVTNKLEEAKQLQGEAGEYVDKAKDIKQIDAKEEVKKLPNELEGQANRIDAVQDVQKELSQKPEMALPQDMKKVESMVSAEDLSKEIAKRKAKRIEVDHLAGQDKTIQGGLAKMEKLQRKYNNLADIRKLPKRRENTLKGKPFIERVTPGISMQVRALDDRWKAIDVSLGAEYLFNDQFRAGIQTSYRVNMMLKPLGIEDRDRVYGFRTVGNYKIAKGFYAHLEGNAFRVPEYLKKRDPKPSDLDTRVWDNSVNVGIFKTYTISKRTRGTVVVLYDLSKLDETLNFGQIAMRFGLEFKFQKKRKVQTVPLPAESFQD